MQGNGSKTKALAMIWIGFGFIIIWLIAGTIANFRKKAAADKADVKIAEGVDGPIEDDTP